MAKRAAETKGRRTLPYLVAGVLLAPIGALTVAKGADTWCDAELMAAGDGSYGDKQLSVSVLPPGVRCTGEIGGDETESFWPINW